jgi:hypothetical protein
MYDRLQFAEVYSRLADDELARIALSNHLVPEAQEALTVEIQKRGLDLNEHKRALEKAAAVPVLERELALQARLVQPSSDRIFIVAAWILAASVPLTFLLAAPPSPAILIKLYIVTAAFIAVSCFRGLKARRDGSRKGFMHKFVLPLMLLGISTAVVLSCKLLGFSL